MTTLHLHPQALDSTLYMMNGYNQPTSVPTLIDTVNLCDELQRTNFRHLSSPVAKFINPVHWNTIAPRRLSDTDFCDRLILYPYTACMAKSYVWVPKNARHGFFDMCDPVCVAKVSAQSTLVYPFDPEYECTLPYVWYKNDPGHTLFCYNICRGFSRIHPSTNVSIIDCELSTSDFQHTMSLTGKVVLVHNAIDPVCPPQKCMADSLTVDEAVLAFLSEVWCSTMVVLVSADFDEDSASRSIYIPPTTTVHIVRVGTVLPVL
jgi:hypothetical protein